MQLSVKNSQGRWGLLSGLAALIWGITVGLYGLSTFWPPADSLPIVLNLINPASSFLVVIVIGLIGGFLSLRVRHPHLVRWILTVSPFALTLLLSLPSRQLTSVIALCYLSLIAWLYGMAILHLIRAQHDDVAEPLVLSLTIGFGSLGLLVFGTGLMGWLRPSLVLGGSGLLAFACLAIARNSIRVWGDKLVATFQAPPPSWFVISCFVPLALFFTVNLIFGLTPEVVFDALKSHLALARIFSSEQRITFLPYSMGSYWPMGGDLLFALGYQLGGETTAKLLHLMAGVIAAGTVYVLGKSLHSVAAGVAATAVFYSTPIISWESSTAYIDLFITMYVSVTLLALRNWLVRRDWASVWCMGLSLGFALGIKPTGGFFALGVGLVMLNACLRGELASRGRIFAMLLAVTTITTLTGGSWYLRTYLFTGNPIFPFLNHIFRSPLWTPTNERFNYEIFGIGQTPLHFVRMLWDLTFHTSKFGENADGEFGLSFLIFFPLAFFFVRQKRIVATFLFVGLVYLTTWFFSVQYLRYLLPLLPLLSLFAGWAVAAAWSALGEKNVLVAGIIPCAFVAVIIFHFPLTLRNHIHLLNAKPTDVLIGRSSREAYREKIAPSARTLKYVNSHLPKETTRIYSVGEYYQFLADAPMVYPFFSLIGNKIFQSDKESELLGFLEGERINYLVINQNALHPSWNFLIHRPEFLEKHARLVYAFNNVYLYRVLKQDPLASRCQDDKWEDLLKNPGFEEVTTEVPNLWTKFGTPSLVSAQAALSGNKSVLVDAVNGFYQPVPVTEQKLYSFSAQVKGQQAEKVYSKLQIVWQDAAGQPLDWSIAISETDQQVKRLKTSVTAPPGSTLAMVYLSTYTGSAIFDDVAFRLRTTEGSCP
jgi:hypothetical protein